ncbi:MAG: hypothetical protein ACRDFX_00280 [Chloroflexota bacterium]
MSTSKRCVAEISDSITLAAETLADATDAREVQAVRSDLNVIRERMSGSQSMLDRAGRELLWKNWQAVNRDAWAALGIHWKEGEKRLAEMLDEGQKRLEAGRPKEVRERIREFHAAVQANETAHHALRKLQFRANELWREAEALGRQKHEVYLQHAARRVEEWTAMRERFARERSATEAEIMELEQRSGDAGTDVGAALLRGQLGQRRKALAELNERNARLEAQIEEVERQLSRN